MLKGLCFDAIAESQLVRMRLPKQVLWDLATKIAGERANVAPNEPPPVVGFETWRWGTRYVREDATLRSLNWVPCDEDQVAGVRNTALRVKLVVCTTDKNTGTVIQPKNVSEKGPANCKLIEQNSSQIEMFPKQQPEISKDDFWYLCFHFSQEYIAIEVSRPDEEVCGFVTNFSDRIVAAKPGDLPANRKVDVPEDFAEVAKPIVTRIE